MRLAGVNFVAAKCREISRGAPQNLRIRFPWYVHLLKLVYCARGDAVSTLAAMSARIASTVKNLRLGANTRVIYQGFTGKQVNPVCGCDTRDI